MDVKVEACVSCGRIVRNYWPLLPALCHPCWVKRGGQ